MPVIRVTDPQALALSVINAALGGVVSSNPNFPTSQGKVDQAPKTKGLKRHEPPDVHATVAAEEIVNELHAKTRLETAVFLRPFWDENFSFQAIVAQVRPTQWRQICRFSSDVSDFCDDLDNSKALALKKDPSWYCMPLISYEQPLGLTGALLCRWPEATDLPEEESSLMKILSEPLGSILFLAYKSGQSDLSEIMGMKRETDRTLKVLEEGMARLKRP